MSAILLAEDNPGDVFLVRQAMAEYRLEAELFVAGDGDEWLALLQRIGEDVPRPDLMLLDLNIPRIDGPELFRSTRAHPLCSDVPLLVVSSSDSVKDRAWTSEYRVAGYFRKPSDYKEFLKLGSVMRDILAGQMNRP